MYPLRPNRGGASARAILSRTTVYIPNIHDDPEYELHALARANDFLSVLSVPVLHENKPIGAITVTGARVGAFSPKQIRLLQTFADQAVIAIENARLFEEVQARTAELQETLDFQTAMSDVLAVISRSPNQLQPVLDAIVRTALGLCPSDRAIIMLYSADHHRFVAGAGFTPDEMTYRLQQGPIPIDHGSVSGRVALQGRTIHVEDVKSDPDYTHWHDKFGHYRRTVLGVPLVRDGTIAGVIILVRSEVEPYTQRQIELVETFADQAVIAMNNARLFEEVQARNRDLTALGEVGRAVSSTLDLKAVLKTIVDRAVNLSSTDAGSIFYYHKDTGSFELGETTGLDEEVVAKFRKLDISAKETGLGEAITKRQPLQFADLTQRPSEPLRDAVLQAGFRASLIVPLLAAEGPLGTLILRRRQPGEFPQSVVSLMQAFADQSAIALENARLFNEIAQKSRELEIASQHKSQFVANMSHELRTPLAAMLGYAELLRDGMFGELPEKSIRIIERVQANGKHLLGLINTVLDISKIESGQFKLSLVEYSLDSMVETVRVATESLASAKKLAFKTDVAKELPFGVGDEPRLTQVLLNLVGNAIKFTDVGEVCISADAKNDSFVVSISDTGPGIPDEERERIFDKFHQVDSTSTKTKGGTGLGLAIAKEIVEKHGGHIWVESIVGRGSTFRLELPVRARASGATA
jgi:signal transduction histidine kinase/putative methionine-R-sulfoxide reductase with GAF domain